MEAAATAAGRAAAQAATGAWLAEMEAAVAAGAPPPRVAAPGLGRGAFGAWAALDDSQQAGVPCSHYSAGAAGNSFNAVKQIISNF